MKIVDKEQLFRSTKQPYNKALLLSIYTSHPEDLKAHIALKGYMPSQTYVYPGCSFTDRCLDASERCQR